MNLICEIEEVFDLTGRGCVIAPGISKETECTVLIGSPLIIVCPDGTELKTTVKGIEMINSIKKPVRFNPILLPRDIEKGQLPKGSKVYLANE